jgi:glycosyltransferase involved in cell wall biosynthesis
MASIPTEPPVSTDALPPGTVAIVVPCYNEAARLRPDVFVEALGRYPWLHLLFVDDGSKDDTRTVLEQLVKRVPGRATAVSLPANAGKAEAVRQGVLRAFDLDAAVVGYWDADLATPLEALPDFFEVFRLRPAVEFVLGSRVRLLGRHVDRSPARHYIGRVFATGASLTLALPVYDTQCGAKLFRVNERVRGLFQQPFKTRWIFDVELIARYLDAPVPDGPADPPLSDRIYELPLRQWTDEPGSKVRTRDGVRAFSDLWRIYRERRRAR